MDDLKIIQLNLDKWEDYKNLRLKALRDNPEAFGQTYEEVVLRTDEQWRMLLNISDDGRKRWVFFAKLNGILVGMVSGTEMRSVPGGVKMQEMFVAEEARGKGIGRKLIESLSVELLKTSDRKVLRIGVFKIQTDAVSFYKDLGFQILEEKTETLSNGSSHESFIMEKLLK